MIIGGNNMKDYRKAKRQIDVSVSESVKILRELQELSQNELATLTGIPQSTISAIENGRVQLARNKMGFPRNLPLWPETIQALKEVPR